MPLFQKKTDIQSANALGSKTYILRSTLDPILIERAAQTEADILEEEAGDQAVFYPSLTLSDEEDDSDEEAERIPKYYGSLISWTKTDQLGSLGILYVILAIILANGRVIADGEWQSQAIGPDHSFKFVPYFR